MIFKDLQKGSELSLRFLRSSSFAPKAQYEGPIGLGSGVRTLSLLLITAQTQSLCQFSIKSYFKQLGYDVHEMKSFQFSSQIESEREEAIKTGTLTPLPKAINSLAWLQKPHLHGICVCGVREVEAGRHKQRYHASLSSHIFLPDRAWQDGAKSRAHLMMWKR